MAREVRGRAAGTTPARPTTSTTPTRSPAPEVAARLLVEAAGGHGRRPRRTAAAVLLGLEGDVEPFARPCRPCLGARTRRSAAGLGCTGRRPRRLGQLSSSGRLLDSVFDRVVGVLDGLDGAAWTDDRWPTLSRPASADHAPSTSDRGDGARRSRPRRRQGQGRRRGVAHCPPTSSQGQPASACATQPRSPTRLGRSVRARPSSSATHVEGEIRRAAWTIRSGLAPDLDQSSLPPLDDTRLVRLAARLSDGAAASASGELYSTDMPVVDAVRLALGSTMPSQRFTVEDSAASFRSGFPGVGRRPRPPRPRPVLAEAGTGLTWDGEAYSVPSAHSDTTFVTQTTDPAIPVRTMEPTGTRRARPAGERPRAVVPGAGRPGASMQTAIAAGWSTLRRGRGQRHRRAPGLTEGARQRRLACRGTRSSLPTLRRPDP